MVWLQPVGLEKLKNTGTFLILAGNSGRNMARDEGKVFVLSGRWYAAPVCSVFLLFCIYLSFKSINSPHLGLKGQFFHDVFGVPAQQIHVIYGATCLILFIICIAWMLFRSTLARRVVVAGDSVTIVPSVIFRRSVTIPYRSITDMQAVDDPGYSGGQNILKRFRECVLLWADGRRYKFGSYSFQSWSDYLEFCDAIGCSRKVS